ncbi:hypothetical protein HDU80_001784 [Chytriomyces hyalinus]|nr:hypothetical protein HDU80_001784 [Chytriomyces hyalinus]
MASNSTSVDALVPSTLVSTPAAKNTTASAEETKPLQASTSTTTASKEPTAAIPSSTTEDSAPVQQKPTTKKEVPAKTASASTVDVIESSTTPTTVLAPVPAPQRERKQKGGPAAGAQPAQPVPVQTQVVQAEANKAAFIAPQAQPLPGGDLSRSSEKIAAIAGSAADPEANPETPIDAASPELSSPIPTTASSMGSASLITSTVETISTRTNSVLSVKNPTLLPTVPKPTTNVVANNSSIMSNQESIGPIGIIIPVVLLLLAIVSIIVTCFRRRANAKLIDAEVPGNSSDAKNRRPSILNLLQNNPPEAYNYARRSSIVATSQERAPLSPQENPNIWFPTLRTVDAKRISAFSELTIESASLGLVDPTGYYQRPSEVDAPKVLMISSNVTQISNAPYDDVESVHVEEETPRASASQTAPKIIFGTIAYETRRWPVAKAVGGRWVWIGENTQVYRGAQDEEDDVVVLHGKEHARAIFEEEKRKPGVTDPKMFKNLNFMSDTTVNLLPGGRGPQLPAGISASSALAPDGGADSIAGVAGAVLIPTAAFIVTFIVLLSLSVYIVRRQKQMPVFVRNRDMAATVASVHSSSEDNFTDERTTFLSDNNFRQAHDTVLHLDTSDAAQLDVGTSSQLNYSFDLSTIHEEEDPDLQPLSTHHSTLASMREEKKVLKRKENFKLLKASSQSESIDTTHIPSSQFVYGCAEFEGRIWPTAKVIGGRWVWVGENTKVFSGSEDSNEEIHVLKTADEARAIFNADNVGWSEEDVIFVENWDALIAYLEDDAA